jgi:nucleoside-diphosphate-sugar epimerase
MSSGLDDQLSLWVAAKVVAERAVWRIYREDSPAFRVSTVVPNMIFGPAVGNRPLESTGSCISTLLEGRDPTNTFYRPAAHFVNVDDCAKLHVAALLKGDLKESRLFACAAPYSWNRILRILRQVHPDRAIMDDLEDSGEDQTCWPSEDAERLLFERYNHGWTSLEATVRQSLAVS